MNMNRLWNSTNPYQGSRTKVLCVCSAGLLRSPTLAHVLTQEGFNTRAVGSSDSFALIPIDEVLCNWADIIICVNQDVFDEVVSKNYLTIEGTKVIVLNVEDDYAAFDEGLITFFENWFKRNKEKLDV